MITTVTLNASIDKAYYMEGSLKNGTVMRVKAVHNSAGGKGLNVARAVHLCGEEVAATGLVGGYNGKYLEALLDQDNIPHDFEHIEGETRSCINILDETFGSTEYLEPGCAVSEREKQKFLERFPKIIGNSQVVTMSGSVPAGLPGDIYKEMILTAKKAGKQVILDTSGELLKKGLEACPTLVKPNQDELELLFSAKVTGREEVIAGAREIYGRGIPYVVVSLGGDGALMVCREGVMQAAAPKVEAVNTVGCGDTMIAGFALGSSEGLSVENTIKKASAMSAAAALREETGFFVREDMERILPQIEIEKLG